MKGIFHILIDGKVRTYHEYDDIPQVIDNVVAFMPEIPPEPHTHEQHEWIENLPEYMNDLMSRERGIGHGD